MKRQPLVFLKMSTIVTKKTPAMVLQELSIKSSSSHPLYEITHKVSDSHENEFHCRVNAMGVCALGKGRSKKEAKHVAAKNALTKLEKEKNIEIKEDFSFEPRNVFAPDEAANDSDLELKPVVNFIGELGDVCLLCNIPPPEFIEVSGVGPSHAMIFTFECAIGDSLLTRATENTKKLAKQVCAKLMLERLKNLYPEIPKEQEEALSICDKTTEAIEIYNESPLRKLNLWIKVNTLHQSLLENLLGADTMMENSDDEYKEWFKLPHNEETLNFILEKKGLNSCYEDLSQDGRVKIVALEVVGDFTLTTLGMDKTEEAARKRALGEMFQVLEHVFVKNC